MLSAIIFLPVVGALLIALLSHPEARTVKRVAAFFTFIPFVLSVILFCSFDQSGGIQFKEQALWISQIDVQYFIGVDGISMPLVILSTFLGFLTVLISWKIELRPKEYFAWLLILESSIIGVFCSLDLLLFFLFWEIEVIPMYFLISIWGGGRRAYSAMKYVLYTLLGSALMLTGILTLYATTGTFDMTVLSQQDYIGQFTAVIPVAAMFFLLFIGFAIKLPMFPFHTWLPDAHTDAPTAGSVMLAGLLIKMGGYGMIRLCVSIFPDVAKDYAPLLVGLAVFSIIYGAAVTLRQTDLKRLIAYSSVSHMGYVLLGIFALSSQSLTGATLQMVSHGLVTGLLFAMVGLVYDRTHTRNIPELGGLAKQMPVIAIVFSVAGMASLGLPGTCGFAAEFITFLGCFSSEIVPGIMIYTLIGVLGIVVTAGYILWLLERVFYTEPKDRWSSLGDADGLEKVAIFTLVVAIFVVGIYPRILTNMIDAGIALMHLPMPT